MIMFVENTHFVPGTLHLWTQEVILSPILQVRDPRLRDIKKHFKIIHLVRETRSQTCSFLSPRYMLFPQQCSNAINDEQF